MQCGGKLFEMHAAVVSCGSEYFRAMLEHAMVESGSRAFEMHEVQPRVLERVVEWLYSGELGEISDVAEGLALLEGSRFLGVERLEAQCVAWLCAHVEASSCGAVWAEASSGLRDHPWLAGRVIEGGEAALRGWPVRQVVRVGGVPTCRFWRDLEDREEIEVVAVNRTGFSGLARGALTVREWREGLLGDLVEEDAEPWLARGRAMRRKFLELCGRLPGSEPALVAGLAERIPRGSEVLTGNSLAVREWNLAAPVGMGHRVHALRGANGIDGNVSAFFGLASEVEEAWCLVGDLTALYDLAAPWVLPQMASGRRRVVVMNNGGGRIFSRLPGLRGMNGRELGLMENPHAWGFRGWAEQWGMGWHGGDGAWLRGGGLGAVEEEHAVIELIPDAEETEAFWVAWVRETMEIGL